MRAAGITRQWKVIRAILYITLVISCCTVILFPNVVDPLITWLFVPTAHISNHADESWASETVATPRMVPYIPFFPKVHFCDDVFAKSDMNFSYNEMYWEHMDSYKSALQLMGSLADGQSDEMSWLHHELVKMPWVKNICEVGFGVGNNAFHWLTARLDVNVHSFIDENNQLSKDMAIYMVSEFPYQYFCHFGKMDSVIKKFFRGHNTTTCDFVYIDGKFGVNLTKLLLDQLVPFISRAGNIIMFGDHLADSESSGMKVWQEEQVAGRLTEYFGCQQNTEMPILRRNASGFLLGSYKTI